MKEKLKNLYNECIKELNSIGIEFNGKDISIKICTKSKRRYGCCRPEITKKNNVFEKKCRKINDFDKYTIEISDWVLQLDDDTIKNTIIHELIHCLPDCNNHGTYFKRYAQYINDELGYNISRLGNKKKDFLKNNIEYKEEKEYNYKITCEKCGNVFYRERIGKDFEKKYRCTCLGKLKVEKI